MKWVQGSNSHDNMLLIGSFLGHLSRNQTSLAGLWPIIPWARCHIETTTRGSPCPAKELSLAASSQRLRGKPPPRPPLPAWGTIFISIDINLINSINSSWREENPFLLAERHVLFSPLSRDQQTLSSIMFGLRFLTYIQLHLNKEVKVKLKINSNKILIYIQGCFCTFYVIYLLRALKTTPFKIALSRS